MESEGDMSSGARSLLGRGALGLTGFSVLSSEESPVLWSAAASGVSLTASFLALDFFFFLGFSVPSAGVFGSDSEAPSLFSALG